MILLVGFPKSGTNSFQNLFTILGYNSIHYRYNGEFIGSIIKKNKLKKRKLLKGLLDVDCITQLDVCRNPNDNYWPQIIDYQQLYQENKEAIFILNKRDPKKILNSFKLWGCKKKKKKFPSCYLDRLVVYNNELLEGIDESKNLDDRFIELVNKHYSDVETFFTSQPNAKFIVFDIEKDDISKLSPYIDTKDIKKLPHANKSIID